MRIQQKGGVWKNTEDEILKAAVMKYGKNQWARISSLLTRKSAKQCKARWQEWLDPSIKKTEWSREEEEKLLHLAKIMPNQWRTIAPAVGRTASQCIEHYEKLLDAAQNKGESYDAAEDPRRLRPGEIDPNPESKPAKPDPVDMDEDEKEMLSEARARLSNTKGKKAKRKAREKQLEEARRLASLQKRRELKAAGITVNKMKKKIRGIDYNSEIPFFKKPPPGFYEVNLEEDPDKEKPFQKAGMSIDEIDTGVKRKRDEEQDKKDNAKKSKQREKKNLPAHIDAISKVNDPEVISQRTRLSLPAAQLTEDALAELAKSEDSLALEGDEEDPDNRMKSATRGLLQNYNLTGATPGATPFRGGMTPGGMTSRTPASARTPARGDYLMREAANILALNNIGTPLAGGENPVLHPSDFSGATPKSKVMTTPNALATPSRGFNAVTPSGTPFRDGMGINTGKAESAAALRAQKKANRAQIQAALLKLPAPQNEYSFVLPEEVEDEPMADDKIIDDASDVIKRAEMEIEEKEQLKLRLRSQVLKRELPRPTSVPDSFVHFESKLAEEMTKRAEELVRAEVVRLIRHEAMEHPLKAANKREDKTWEQFSEQQLRDASNLIAGEAEQAISTLSLQDLTTHLDNDRDNSFLFVPSSSSFVRSTHLSHRDQIENLSARFDTVRGAMAQESSKAKKLEAKVNVYTMGYQKRAVSLLQSVRELNGEKEGLRDQIYAYEKLRELEVTAMSNRVEGLAMEVKKQEEREMENQRKYRNLMVERQQLLSQA
ncbi:hypothetical protein PROFUN_06131 [Planoprotostelium fungivorum]|uniref:Cell division cycle 5-like protein n=1 Tax=Planoprotostelium fungivorum TaxID=1890364 RepID=A0A2P6NPH3_9EUKA|nr:hypothetical protein PROFUN_06131 [Planoprotostelium fungivorum]